MSYTFPPESISPFPSRPLPPPASPAVHDHLPPQVPPKLPPPPPPPPPPATTTTFPPLPFPPSPDHDSFIVPISSAPTTGTSTSTSTPASSTRSVRQRNSLSLSTNSQLRLHSRTTSIDYASSSFALANADTGKDLPLAIDSADEDDHLLGSSTTSRMRRRNPPQPATASATRQRLRLVLLLTASAAVVVLLLSAVGGTEALREKMGRAKDRVVGSLTSQAAARLGVAAEEGGNGDRIKLDGGNVVQYRNAFGGTFSSSPATLSARPQNDTPPLSEPWDFETMRMRGVNLGGWLTLEPFITPALFEPYMNATIPAEDEWTLSLNLRGEGRLEQALREHYDTFITEQDFLSIAAAGLNWIRLPVPYWAIKTWSTSDEAGGGVAEPFLEGVAWEYVLKALRWARKYGLRINFDLHSIPGSQNGWNHSGRLGSINFLHGTMGFANAQRALDYIATVAEFLTMEEVAPIVPMYSLLNEPMLAVIGPDALRSFYTQAYETVRNITGYGKGNGPFLALHDGFKGTRRWHNFLEEQPPSSSNSNTALTRRASSTGARNGLDRVALDSHRYLAFAEPDLRDVREQVMKPCHRWAPEFNKTALNFGIAISGEWSLAVNDCGRFLNNVFQGTRLEGTYPNASQPMYPPSAPLGTCEFWEDYEAWTDDFKASLQDLALAQMDTFQNWFYWTWKTGPSLLHPNRSANPLWSYSLGLSNGWIPSNPLEAHDFCFTYPSSSRASPDTAADGLPRQVPLRKLEPWKVGDAVPASSSSSPSEEEAPLPNLIGHLSPSTKTLENVPWPPLAFDLPDGEYGAGGLPISGLPAYSLLSSAAAGVYLPGLAEWEAGGSAMPRLLFGGQGEGEREGGRKWVAPIEGCEYPKDAWNAVEDLWKGEGNCTAGGVYGGSE
ncbi:hypothetical protein JCM11641_001645 [Rhodosporidiobolus odoratus]